MHCNGTLTNVKYIKIISLQETRSNFPLPPRGSEYYDHYLLWYDAV
jgi:hypothetical protein